MCIVYVQDPGSGTSVRETPEAIAAERTVSSVAPYSQLFGSRGLLVVPQRHVIEADPVARESAYGGWCAPVLTKPQISTQAWANQIASVSTKSMYMMYMYMCIHVCKSHFQHYCTWMPGQKWLLNSVARTCTDRASYMYIAMYCLMLLLLCNVGGSFSVSMYAG